MFNKIGEYLGYQMWDNRNKNLQYGVYGCKSETDDDVENNYVERRKVTFKYQNLIIYNYKGEIQCPLYILNLKTFKPTKNSINQTLLSNEILTTLQSI